MNPTTFATCINIALAGALLVCLLTIWDNQTRMAKMEGLLDEHTAVIEGMQRSIYKLVQLTPPARADEGVRHGPDSD